MKKLLSFMLSLAMLASLVVTSSSIAFAAEETGVKAYVADRTGIVGSYEGNYSEHNKNPYMWNVTTYKYNATAEWVADKGIETITIGNSSNTSGSKAAAVIIQKPVSKETAKKMIVTAKVTPPEGETSLSYIFRYHNGGTNGVTIPQKGWTTGPTLSFDTVGVYKEYSYDTDAFTSFDTDEFGLFRIDPQKTPATLDIAHIRFVDETYGKEIKVSNGSGGNNHLNDIMRFEFAKELNRETVKAENIQINGVPATYIIENKDTDSANSLRVRLATLAEASRYTVTFNGLKYADGTDVTDVFKFATENESIPVYPESLKAYKTARTGIVAAWEGTKASDFTWYRPDWANSVCTYDADAGVANIKYTSDTNPLAFFNLANPISEASTITKMVIGLKTNNDADLKLYYAQGVVNNGSGFVNTAMTDAFSVKKGDGGYAEYTVSMDLFTGFTDGMQSFRLNPVNTGTMNGLELDIAYIRFVTDEYQARKSEIQNFAKDYSHLNDSVRFAFTKDLDSSTVKAENITINGTKNAVDVFNVKDNTVCVRFGNIPSVSRCRVTFPNMKYSDGTAVDEQFVFTTTGTGLLGALEFTNDADAVKVAGSGTVSCADGKATVVTAGDGYMHIYFDEPIPVKKVKYIDIRLKESNQDSAYTNNYYDMKYYFLLNGKGTATSTDPVNYGSGRVTFNDTWHELRFDVANITGNLDKWTGATESDTLTGMRIDVGANKTAVIDYIRVVSDYYDDKKNDAFLTNEIPAATYELVSGFETENEAVLGGTLPSGVITAVTGGLCGVADAETKYSLYLALYDNGNLIGVDCKHIILAPGMEVSQQTLNVTVPQKQDGDSDNRYSVKAFLWEADELTPCVEAVTPSNNGI